MTDIIKYEGLLTAHYGVRRDVGDGSGWSIVSSSPVSGKDAQGLQAAQVKGMSPKLICVANRLATGDTKAGCVAF